MIYLISSLIFLIIAITTYVLVTEEPNRRKRLAKEEWEKAPRASKKYYELLNKEK